MTKEEAITVLGLPNESVTEAEIKSKYNELFNEFQIRLTNAPTPNLKKLYQKNLQELLDARDFLLGDFTNVPISDLPSEAPIFNATARDKTKEDLQGTSATSGTRSNLRLPGNIKKTNKLSTITIIAFGVAILGMAGSAYFGFTNIDISKKTEPYEKIKISYDSLQNAMAPFSNYQFKLKNDSKGTIVIKNLIVTFRGSDGKLAKWFGTINTSINPGSEKLLNWKEGNNLVWDGSVIAYYCNFEYKGGESIYAGIWENDASKEDNMLHLRFD